ncbi:MAG: hypothetical protein LBR75_01635, partial [Prevotellaceae bacterium]|nr:hypothetical protein [Prevotellaceae bacterium]
MKRKTVLSILIIPILLLFVASCRTVKPTDSLTIKPDKSLSTGKIKLNNTSIRTANFSSLSVSLNAGGKSLSSRASMKIICDSIIQ